jgi:hypothetical protein
LGNRQRAIQDIESLDRMGNVHDLCFWHDVNDHSLHRAHE